MAVACGFTVMLAGTAQAEVWKEAKNQDGIKVSLSDVPGSDYKAYQGIALINASVSKLRALREDVAGPAPDSRVQVAESAQARRQQDTDLQPVQHSTAGDASRFRIADHHSGRR